MTGSDRTGVDDAAGEGLEHRPDALDRLGSPPTITSSVPSQASLGVRLSGASMRVIPFGASVSARRRVEAGSEVEQSTIMSGFPAEASPSGP